jgi:hypothetical protein
MDTKMKCIQLLYLPCFQSCFVCFRGFMLQCLCAAHLTMLQLLTIDIPTTEVVLVSRYGYRLQQAGHMRAPHALIGSDNKLNRSEGRRIRVLQSRVAPHLHPDSFTYACREENIDLATEYQVCHHPVNTTAIQDRKTTPLKPHPQPISSTASKH